MEQLTLDREIESLEERLAEIDTLTIPQKGAEIKSVIPESFRLARRSVIEAYYAGRLLQSVKSDLGHGNFHIWLKNNAINRETSRRFMRLADSEMTQVMSFDSVDAALKAIPKPQKEETEKNKFIDPKVIVEEKLTTAEKRILREDALVQQACVAEEEKAKAEEELKRAQQKIKLFEEEKNLEEGFQRGASVLDQAQQEVSNLRAKLADKEIRERELMSESHSLKRRIRQLEKQLEAFKEGEV